MPIVLPQRNTSEKIRRTINLNNYQDSFIFDDSFKYKFLKSGWATGKSLCLILAVIRQCEMYPNNLGVIYRKEATDLRDSTIKQFEELTGMRVDSSRNVEFGNKSCLMFRHKEDIFGTVQNINMGFAGIEEHAELDTDELFYLLFGRLRRENTGLRFFSVGNANGHNWVYKIKQNGVYDLEKDPERKHRLDLHLSATTYENAHNLPPEFISSLIVLKNSKPHFYNRFVMNSDEEADNADIIINPTDIYRAVGKELNTIPPYKRIVSIDVSRFGDDKTVCYAIENNEMLAKDEWEKKSTMETVGRAVLFAKKHKITSFAIDEIGVGGGVADRLAELGNHVIYVNASERASGSMYYNRRAEIYQKGADLFANGMVSILASDTDLIEQLSWAKYKTVKSNGVYQVEAKEDIKKRYKRSSDNADAFLNGLWALPQAKEIKQMDKYERSFLKIRNDRMNEAVYV